MKYLKIFTDFRSAMEPLTNEEAGSLFRAMLLYAENGTESELSGNERYLWIVAKQHIDREAEAYAAKVEAGREGGRRSGESRKAHKPVGEAAPGKNKQTNQDNDNENNNNNEKDNEISFLSAPAPTKPAVERMSEPVDTPSAEKKETYSSFGWIDSVLEPEKPEKREKADTGDGEKKEGHPSLEEVKAYVRDTYLPVDGEHFYNYYQANGWMMGSQPMRDWRAAIKAWARNAPVVPRPGKQQPSTLDNFRAAMDMLRREEARLIN